MRKRVSKAQAIVVLLDGFQDIFWPQIERKTSFQKYLSYNFGWKKNDPLSEKHSKHLEVGLKHKSARFKLICLYDSEFLETL